MTQLQPPTVRAAVAARVQATLDRHQPRAYRVAADPEAILEDDDWYHVVVVTPDDRRDRDFYDCLSESEAELNDQLDGHFYLLVPAIAD